MKKIKFLSINKYEKRSSYTFPKKEIVFDMIFKLAEEFGFGMDPDSIICQGHPKKGQKLNIKFCKDVSIKGYVDLRWLFENEECYIELIFGKERVFLTIHASKDNQEKALKIILKFTKID